jgi:hypothetical protein
MPDKTFKVGNDIFEIPDSEVSSFLSDTPDAIEIQSFVLGKDTFDIPIGEVEGFLLEMPDAQPLKKKEESVSEDLSSLSQRLSNPSKAPTLGVVDPSIPETQIAHTQTQAEPNTNCTYTNSS